MVSILNATELFTFKWLILCDMNFTSIGKEKTDGFSQHSLFVLCLSSFPARDEDVMPRGAAAIFSP